METLTDQNWLLSVGTFLPLVGVLVMMFIPRDEESTHKTIGIVTAGATLAIGIVTMLNFDYDQADKLQFSVDVEWISVIHSNYTVGLDGISLPLVFRPSQQTVCDPGPASAFTRVRTTRPLVSKTCKTTCCRIGRLKTMSVLGLKGLG